MYLMKNDVFKTKNWESDIFLHLYESFYYTA